MESTHYFFELAKEVAIRTDARRGRHLLATHDIPPGRIVCMQRGISVTVSTTCCTFCTKRLNLKGTAVCDSCHQSEFYQAIDQVEGELRDDLRQHGLLELAIRIVLAYPPCEIVDTMERKGISANVTNFDYIAQLQVTKDPVNVRGYLIDKLILRLEKLQSTWTTITNYGQKFKEAVLFVLERLPDNAHSIFDLDMSPQIHDMHPSAEFPVWILQKEIARALEHRPLSHSLHSPPEPMAVGLFPVSSIINHSCRPNTFSYTLGNLMIYRSRGIRKGDEITDCYGPNVWNHTLEERKIHLSRRGFECWCDECEQGNCLRNTFEGTFDGNPLADDECLLDADQLDVDYKELLRKFQNIKERSVPGNLELDRFAHFLSVIAARQGDFDCALEAISILEASLQARGIFLCPERGYLAHAKALVLLHKWKSSSSRTDLVASQKSSFTALVTYRTFFGNEGKFAELLDTFKEIFDDK